MNDGQKPFIMIQDYATGKEIPRIGAEENRQAVERFLVEEKGYDKTDIEIDIPIELTVNGTPYRSKIDLAVRVAGERWMVIKCAAGSLGSREREVVSAARLLDKTQIPLAVASDGSDAILLDTVTGKRIGYGMKAIPSKAEAASRAAETPRVPYPEARMEKEKLIFRTYDMENVNRTLPE